MGLTSCTDQCVEGEIDTFFKGTKGGEKLKGDGVAFILGDNSVQLHLLAGDAQFYDGIYIVLNNQSTGSYIIPEGEGSLAEVIGLDAVGNSYMSNGLPSDIINITWDMEMGYVEGDFEFMSTGRTDGAELKVDGSFRVQFGMIEENWECGFLKFEPDSDCCRFIR